MIDNGQQERDKVLPVSFGATGSVRSSCPQEAGRGASTGFGVRILPQKLRTRRWPWSQYRGEFRTGRTVLSFGDLDISF